MEGEVELKNMVEANNSEADYEKIDDESVRLDEESKNSDYFPPEHVISYRNEMPAPELKKTIESGTKSKVNFNKFKYQDLDLSMYGTHLVGFKSTFDSYLEDLEIYTFKTPDLQEY